MQLRSGMDTIENNGQDTNQQNFQNLQTMSQNQIQNTSLSDSMQSLPVVQQNSFRTIPTLTQVSQEPVSSVPRPMQEQNIIFSKSLSDETLQNQNLMTQVQLSPQIKSNNSFTSQLQAREQQLEIELQNIKMQLENKNFEQNIDSKFQEVSVQVSTFQETFLQLQFDIVQTQEMKNKVTTLKYSLETYQHTIKPILKLLNQNQSQKQSFTEIYDKCTQLLNFVKLRVELNFQRILNNRSDNTYQEILISLRNLYQQVYDTLNSIKQKQYNFLVSSLLKTSSYKSGTSIRSDKENDEVHYSAVENPLFDQNLQNQNNKQFQNLDDIYNSTLLNQQPQLLDAKNQQNFAKEQVSAEYGNPTVPRSYQYSVPQPTLLYPKYTMPSQPVNDKSNNSSTTRQLPPPKFEKFSGEGNATMWLNRFERSAKKYQMTDQEKLDEALNCLIKGAERWAARNMSELQSFENFQKKLLAKYVLPSETLQEQLVQTKQNKGETNQQFLDRLTTVAGQGDVSESSLKVYFLNNLQRQDVCLHLQRFLTDNMVDTVELLRQANNIQSKIDFVNQRSNNYVPQRNVQPVRNKPQQQQGNQQRNYQQNNSVKPYVQNNQQNKPQPNNYQNQQNQQNKPYIPNKQYQNNNNNNANNNYNNNRNNPRINFIDQTTPEEQENTPKAAEEEIYDHEETCSEEQGEQQQQQYEPQEQDNPPINFISLGNMLTETSQPRVSAKVNSLNSCTETIKVQKEVKPIQQYFTIENYFRNQNVQIKLEDLIQSSPLYKEQLTQYVTRLNSIQQDDKSEKVTSLYSIRPKFKVQDEICKVTVPIVNTQLSTKIKIQGVEVFGFLDTGASKCCISKSFVDKHQIGPVQTSSQQYTLVNGSQFMPEGFIKLQVEFDPYLIAEVEAAVVQNTSFDFLFGLDLYEAFNCYIQRQQLFYKNPHKNRYSSIILYKTQQNKMSQSMLVTSEIYKQVKKKLPQLNLLNIFSLFIVLLSSKSCIQKDLIEKSKYDLTAVLKYFKQMFEKNQNFSQLFFKIINILIFIKISDCGFQKKQFNQSLNLYNISQVKPAISQKVDFPNFPYNKKYQLIITDFPWQYETEKYLKPPYPTMNFEQMKQIPLQKIADKNCVFLFWVTGPKLHDCFQLISHFKLQYVTSFTIWRKIDKGKLYQSKGSYTIPNYEQVLLAQKGNISEFKRQEKATVQQELQAQVQRHSTKPCKFYQVVNQVFKTETLQCIELFARIQKHSYLDLYGNAIKGYFTPSLKLIENKYIDHKGTTKMFSMCNTAETSSVIRKIFYYFQKRTQLSEEHLLLLSQMFKNSQQEINTLYPLFYKLLQLLCAFAFQEHEVGTTSVLKHTIELEQGAQLKAQSPYRLTGPERDFVKEEIKHLELLGYIVRDVSPHAAPIVVVKKENGKHRMCIDFRDLNKYTVPHHWPLPQIDVLLTYLHGANIFSKLDLRSGFFNISLKESDQYKTSFVCPFGQYKYTRMPFGLRNAPSTFQRAMEDILRDVLYKFALVYIDDVIVFSKTLEEHFQQLETVLKLVIKSGIKLHPEKCQMCVSQVEFLGHQITYNKVYPKESKTAKIETLPAPKTVKKLQSFLGFTSYYRKFIKNYSKIAQPLQDLIRKENKYEWLQVQQDSFNSLKRIVTSQPHLKIPDLNSRFYLCTDFCNEGLGAVLSQIDEETNSEKPIEYASRTLNVHEAKYGSYEGECLAVIWAFSKFRHFLLGKEFTLYTDNKALSWILTNRNPSPKIARWLLIIQEYNFITHHRSGKSNSNADSLSRLASDLNTSNETSKDASELKLSQFLTFNQFTDQVVDQYYEEEPLYKPTDIGDLQCELCHSLQPDKMLLCEGCGKGFHYDCLTPPLKQVPENDFYCENCKQRFTTETKTERDITIDETAQLILRNQLSFEKLSKEDQVIYKNKVQGYVWQNNKIFKVLNGKNLLVPTLYQRQQITEEYHENLSSHASARRTLQLIQNKYYWPKMEKYILDFISKCAVCVASNKSIFKQHNDLFTTEKGMQPFQVWSVDLVTGLPLTKNNNTIIFVIVDCFSKWTEAVALQDKTSVTIAKQFYETVICRYGKPLQVRSDGGSEFQGSFDILLENLGVQHVTTSPYYAKSNGQAERVNRTLIQSLKKNIAQRGLPLHCWDVLLPHVLFSLRFCKHKVTEYSPFKIIFSKDPELMSPLDFASELNIPPISKEFIQNYMVKIAKIQNLLFPKIKQNLENQPCAACRNSRAASAPRPERPRDSARASSSSRWGGRPSGRAA